MKEEEEKKGLNHAKQTKRADEIKVKRVEAEKGTIS